MSMNGSNGPALPIIVEPDDGEGLTTEIPEHAFYICTPQFHCTILMGVEDRPDGFAVESIAHKQYRFGT